MIDKKVLDYSKKMVGLGIKNKILEHSPLVEATAVVAELGYTLDDSVATLIMKADNNFVAVLRRDVTKISFKKIRKLLNAATLRIATPEEFHKITGLEAGEARFYVENVKTYIDKRVFEKKNILGGTGSLSYTFQCLSSDLKKLPNSQIVDISTLVEEQAVDSNNVKRVLSGIRATGRLHLGNYLGAIKGMIELQNNPKYETLYMVADVHTITTPYKINELKINRREVIIDYLAAGLDPKKTILFQQAEVNEHIELAFFFSSVVSIARMQHLPTFKEKVAQYPQNVTLALLNYPVLMAADILVYKAGLVPVGIDQEPHLEVTREIARKMNQIYGTDFPEPVRFATKGEYIPSLSGEGKMSKTVVNSFINLADSFEEIKKKIRSVPTATTAGGEMSAGIKTLFTFGDLFTPNSMQQYKDLYNKGILKFVDLKDDIAHHIFEELKPFQKERAKIAANQKYVDEVIKDGAKRARKIAQETIKEVKQKMGLL